MSLKLPLTVRKDVRDTADRKSAVQATASSIVGYPVTFNYDLEAVYAALAGNGLYQPCVVQTSLEYFTQTVAALAKCFVDPLVKAEVNKAWLTKNFSVSVLGSEDELERMRDAPATAGSNTSHVWRLRIHHGDLQLVTDAQHWGLNTHEIERTDLTPLANGISAFGTDALPLEIKKLLREAHPLVDVQLGRIRSLEGLRGASFDVDAHTLSTYPLMKYEPGWQHFSPTTFAEYLDGVASLLETLWKDAMNSEALLDVWTAPHTISVIAEVDLERAQGTMVCNQSYHAIKLDGSNLAVLVGVGRWRINMAQVSQLCLVKVL